MAKIWVVEYNDLPLGNCRLHEKSCRYLRPTSNRPDTVPRLATKAELKTQQPCKVC